MEFLGLHCFNIRIYCNIDYAFLVNMRNFILIDFSPGDSHTILGCEAMDISVEDDERTLTMIEDLCSEDVHVEGNCSCRSPAPLADDDRDAAAASLADTSSKSVKENKEEILTELEEVMKKLTVVNADLGEFSTIQQKSRFLVSKEKLLELAGVKCKVTVDDHTCGSELNCP